MKNTKAKNRLIFLTILVLLAAALCVELYRSNCLLTVDHYRVQSRKVTGPVRVVHLTDLHNAEFGPGNTDLLAQVTGQKPDVILFTGDLVTGYIEEAETAAALLEKLTAIAPVYVSIGNHEQRHEETFGSDLTSLYENAGATVLEYEWEEIEVGGQVLRIGGISGIGYAEKYLETGDATQEECDFLRTFQDTENCTLLMSHLPVGWLRLEGIDEWDIDLVFSGHAHGGQFVIPGIGGVYGPDMGFFPGRLEGLFPSEAGEKTLVLSRGLGNSVSIPRLNNPPQVLVLDIVPEES